jgi:3-phosphoshikimate 1-carboxyvinyltransferase
VSLKASSQFASALLLAQKRGGWDVEVLGENEEEASYVSMTRQLVETFPKAGGTFAIEPDASSASYFVAANYLLSQMPRTRDTEIVVHGLPESDWQVDNRFASFLPLPANVSRTRDLADSILTAILIAPFSKSTVRFTELGRLRVQECDRVLAMREGLDRCGAMVREEGDTLTIQPSAHLLHGAEIETFGDHRIAMCFAVLGLVVPGIKIKNPACVKKTFPNFFQKLASPSPGGLGTAIRNTATGESL